MARGDEHPVLPASAPAVVTAQTTWVNSAGEKYNIEISQKDGKTLWRVKGTTMWYNDPTQFYNTLGANIKVPVAAGTTPPDAPPAPPPVVPEPVTPQPVAPEPPPVSDDADRENAWLKMQQEKDRAMRDLTRSIPRPMSTSTSGGRPQGWAKDRKDGKRGYRRQKKGSGLNI